MSTKKSALGKGLSALLENSQTDVTSRAGTEGMVGSVAQIPVNQIEVNPFQPRTEFDKEALAELAASIKEQGIIQPITVRKMGYDKYQIISGERRFRASQLAGLTTIPAYIRVANDQGMLELALVENIQRENLNPIEVAISFKRLIDECALTQEVLSERVGKNRTTVTNFLRLLKLPPEIQAAVRDGSLSMGHARAIAGIEDVARQLEVFRDVLKGDLNVRETESLARQSGNRHKTKSKSGEKKGALHFELEKIQQGLSNHFSTRVRLERTGSWKGKITIPFEDNDDLNRILELLNY